MGPFLTAQHTAQRTAILTLPSMASVRFPERQSSSHSPGTLRGRPASILRALDLRPLGLQTKRQVSSHSHWTPYPNPPWSLGGMTSASLGKVLLYPAPQGNSGAEVSLQGLEFSTGGSRHPVQKERCWLPLGTSTLFPGTLKASPPTSMDMHSQGQQLASPKDLVLGPRLLTKPGIQSTWSFQHKCPPLSLLGKGT